MVKKKQNTMKTHTFRNKTAARKTSQEQKQFFNFSFHIKYEKTFSLSKSVFFVFVFDANWLQSSQTISQPHFD
jgi:hypothetical protein